MAMNRRSFLYELSLATGITSVVGMWAATQVQSTLAYRPMPDNHGDDSNKQKRRRKGWSNGKHKGKGKRR
jgi:hypothetical protein